MSVAEKVATGASSLSWTEICDQHHDEWVCLIDVQQGPDGAIRSGQVIAHDRSMRQVLARIDSSDPGCVVVHTAGRAPRFPRIEMTDEIRDIVRPQR